MRSICSDLNTEETRIGIFTIIGKFIFISHIRTLINMTYSNKARPRNTVREQFEEGTNDGTTPAAGGFGAYTFPAPEEILPCVLYAFTFNPKMQPLDQKQVLHCELNWLKDVNEVLGSLPNFNYQVNVELSSKGRWHLHGVCAWLTGKVAGFYAWDIHRMMARGTVCIKPISKEYTYGEQTGLKGWVSYCNKQKDVLKEYLAIRNIPYTSCSELFQDCTWDDLEEDFAENDEKVA